MSEISKNEQTAVVKQAMEYERSILKLKRQLEELNDESFRDEPEPPIRKIASPNYSSLPTLTFTFTDYATRAIEYGMQPKILQKLLGHASIKTTMDTYVHVTEDSLTNAVQQFEASSINVVST